MFGTPVIDWRQPAARINAVTPTINMLCGAARGGCLFITTQQSGIKCGVGNIITPVCFSCLYITHRHRKKFGSKKIVLASSYLILW